MREDVLVVLNEREPLKRQMAMNLEQQLQLRRIAVDSIKPGPEIIRIIRERSPRLLVLDYLLGDFGTALDVLQSLHGAGGEQPIRTILWTDEPSAHVAVTAMKFGAEDYIEIDSANSLQRVISAIEYSLKKSTALTRSCSAGREPGQASLVFEAPASQVCMAQLHSLATRKERLVVILGERGAGRNVMAQYLHQLRQKPGRLVEIDLDLWTGNPAELFAVGPCSQRLPLLSYAATVVIDHSEFDGGELLDLAQLHLKYLLETGEERLRPLLVIGTSSEATAQLWRSLLNAEVVQIPALTARSEDLLPLLQQCVHETRAYGRTNRLEINPQVLEFLKGLDWPGNIREFRAVIIEALTTPILAKNSPEDNEQAAGSDQENRAAASSHEIQAPLLELILDAKQRWEKFALVQAQTPDPYRAWKALQAAGGDWRLAAITLGTGVPQLRHALLPQPQIPEDRR